MLSNISVPVRLKAQIADPIDGAINNLAIVLQMIQVEKDANAQRQEGNYHSEGSHGWYHTGGNTTKYYTKGSEVTGLHVGGKTVSDKYYTKNK